MAHPQHGAFDSITGVVSARATWTEEIYVQVNGEPATGFDDDEWHITFRRCIGGTPDLTLTSDEEITYTEGVTSVLGWTVPVSTLKVLCGDYVTDIASKNLITDEITHWAHGMVTFQNNPVDW